ncbi:hypothetical protein ACN20G_19615 [Streptomyces sp. BI20]|uniref:hypothetical protein n=1 Tax=Streptomyces sp. BI20 TaxID=3403460 RepID=UPI003C73C974
MSWDGLALVILAASGCVMLLLAQVGEVLAKLPGIIRAWRAVREELRGRAGDPEGPAELGERHGPGGSS